MDDNLIDFKKRLGANNSNKAESIEKRIINCASQKDCECKYCAYKKQAAEMVVDFLSRDINSFESSSDAKCCTFDLKDVFFKAIYVVKELENEGNID